MVSKSNLSAFFMGLLKRDEIADLQHPTFFACDVIPEKTTVDQLGIA